MASVEAVVFDKLTAIVGGSESLPSDIFPSFRDDVVPSLVYDLDVESADATYELSGPISYELTILVVAATLKQAMEIADILIDNLDRQTWSDNGFRVISCFLRDREKDTHEIASKNLRINIVTLRFDFTVDAFTAGT